MQAVPSDLARQASQPDMTVYQGTTTIGSANSNIMVLSIPGVSDFHAIIITMNKTAYRHDPGSLNGVYVNNRPVHTNILHRVDQINIGDDSFKAAGIQ